MMANGKDSIVLLVLFFTNVLLAQTDYSKYRLFDSGYVDFTTKTTQYINKAQFELPWLYQGKYDSVDYIPVGLNQANRYTFIQDTAGTLRYYADHAGVYSNRSGILFKSYLMNKKVPVPGCWPSDSFYPIPNATKFNCGIQLDTLENFGYSNFVRFGKTNHYGVGIWDYLNNGFRLLRLSYDPIGGDRIVSSSILPNAGKFTTITCGPNDSTFCVVTMLENRHTIQVYLWSFSSLQLNQSIEIGDTSHLKAYAQRMKFSPDNSKMVLMKRYKNSTEIFGDQSNPENTSYLFDFNAQKGLLSNKQKISIYGNQLEFSPNSLYLYIKHAFSTMDSNMYLIKNETNTGYLSRFTIKSQSTKLLFKKSNSFLFNIQLLPDGNIYWYNTVDNNMKYVFERLENCNDTQSANFKKYSSNIDVVNGWRFGANGVGYSIYPEILPCKCYEPEPKPGKMESCGNDTLVIQNHFKWYDSLQIDWGDGSSNVYKQLDSSFKHVYDYSGKYIVRTNYKSVFQEFKTIDTIVTTSNQPLNIPKDTFFCPTDTLSIDLAYRDSNLVWSSTAKSRNEFNQSGSYKYQYQEQWCQFVDSIHVTKRNRPWDLPFQDTVICKGGGAKVVVPSNLKVQWNNNPTDSLHTKLFGASGVHSIKFSDGICNFGDTVSVELAPSMNLGVVQLDTTICHQFSDLVFQIQGDVPKMKSIIWNSEFTNAQRFTTRKLDAIQITAIDSFGCSEKVNVSPISQCNPSIFIHNAFTPNGFGPDVNENFKPIIKDGKLTSFKIYNRWGEKIFDNLDNQGWDGTYKHAKSPEGVYIYEIEIVTNFKESNYIHRYFGNFQLIR